jgi:hypothetical protein
MLSAVSMFRAEACPVHRKLQPCRRPAIHTSIRAWRWLRKDSSSQSLVDMSVQSASGSRTSLLLIFTFGGMFRRESVIRERGRCRFRKAYHYQKSDQWTRYAVHGTGAGACDRNAKTRIISPRVRANERETMLRPWLSAVLPDAGVHAQIQPSSNVT